MPPRTALWLRISLKKSLHQTIRPCTATDDELFRPSLSQSPLTNTMDTFEQANFWNAKANFLRVMGQAHDELEVLATAIYLDPNFLKTT
jgi:hypothetical protein